MYARAERLLALMLTLAVLLAPLRVVYADDVPSGHCGTVVQQHDAGRAAASHPPILPAADHGADDRSGHGGSCSDCVYCSPALALQPAGLPAGPRQALPAASGLADYSIHLPVTFRPPRAG